MLDYEWGNPSTIILTGNEEDEPTHHEDSDQTHRQIFDQYASQSNALLPDHFLSHHQPSHNTNPTNSFPHHHNHHHHHHHHSFNPQAHNPIHHPLFDPRAFAGASSTSYPPPLPPAPQPHNSLLSLDPLFVVPKTEDFAANSTSSNPRLGLNLGGRTYFSTDDDFVNRLYRRSRAVEPGSSSSSNPPKCQAEGCNADLSNAKHYHRRHKVCEFHSKAATVIAAGLTQRFCQQCSRFHLLAEFDNGKRSCRKRLADHNRRRRKSQQQPCLENQKPQQENPLLSSSNNVSRSQSDPAGAYSSSVTVALSSSDYVRPRPFQSTSSSTTTNSPFFSSGC